MDQWKPAEGFFHGTAPAGISGNGFPRDGDLGALSGRFHVSCPDSSLRVERETPDPPNARKLQKADREKLRRDRLNEQFVELGNVIVRAQIKWTLLLAADPNRPKNDKATILGDAIQMLKDMTAQVHKLKDEHTSLSDESQELAQEKNELREEKAALKSEIGNLNVQYQQRLRYMYPWATVDPSVVMGPPPPYPVPMPVSLSSVPMPFHTSIQPYPFLQNQSPGVVPNPYSSYHPYTSSCNPYGEQQSAQRHSPHLHPNSNRHHATSRHGSRTRSSDQQHCSGPERSADYSDVITELELKMPGSAEPSSNSKPAASEKDSSTERMKGSLSRQSQSKGGENADGSSSSRCSSPSGPRTSSSNSNGGGSVANS